jgi:hypothetical protein
MPQVKHHVRRQSMERVVRTVSVEELKAQGWDGQVCKQRLHSTLDCHALVIPKAAHLAIYRIA